MFQNITAQNPEKKTKFHSPVDIPISLSGNFAEIRSDHFHSGIDIRTQGVEGKKVYSIDDGYVSRIKIQTNGYGKSIYINHPGGFTSVYGHLSSYNAVIDNYVKNYQYKNQTHTLDLYPAKNELIVKRAEVIALSGNSGSSAGPHLHFEIRNSANQHPLNVLEFGFDVKDEKTPRILSFYLYTFNSADERRTTVQRKKIEISSQDNNYSFKTDKLIEISRPVSFGIESFDYLNGSGNRCGLYTIEVLINNEAFYSFKTDEFSFAESRYLNSLTDYRLRQNENLKVYNLFRRPNNPLSMVKYTKNNGILIPEPGIDYSVNIKITDVYGNPSELNFKLKGAPNSDHLVAGQSSEDKLFLWDQNNEIINHLLKFYLPVGSLYEDCKTDYRRVSGGTPIHPWEHILGDPGQPLHKRGELMLKLENSDYVDLDKVVVIRKNEKGEWTSEGGKSIGDGWIKTQVYNFGTFSLETDTVAPEIRVVNLTKNANLASAETIRFLVSDKLSGISSYKGYIDNEWVLFEYDPKNDLLFYEFDKNRLKRGQKHELELYVTDEKENTSFFHGVFTW